jgi:hypothetical protein
MQLDFMQNHQLSHNGVQELNHSFLVWGPSGLLFAANDEIGCLFCSM